VLLLVVLMVASSQAEICPMKLASQHADACVPAAAGMHHGHHQAQMQHGHECCPSGHGHVAAQTECPPAQITACNSKMTCCSIDPQPAGSTKSAQVPQPQATVAPRIAAAPPLVRVTGVAPATMPKLEDSVFRHKEDLRI